ncbi:MAG: T9SS type A sorting domain-containing protein [Crocinitomicaceae bacterium]|nr:T9SS type A sorting domain-containing protein [Crocinitomicaceae bacterium]
MRYYKNRLRYIVSRWGFSTNIGNFELMNEINLIGDGGSLYLSDPNDPLSCTKPDGDQYNPYRSTPNFPEVIYNWQNEMARYIKQDLGHGEHLIAVNYAGSPALNGSNPDSGLDLVGGDSSYFSPYVDIRSYNDYGTGFNKTKSQFERFNDLVFYDLSNASQGYNQKPLMNSEIGSGDCDNDFSFKQDVIMTAFTGSATAGLPWYYNNTTDEYSLTAERESAWSAFKVIKDFMQGIHLDAGPWKPGYDRRDDLLAELLYLKSQEGNKRAIGVINNKTVNYYNQRMAGCETIDCDCYQPDVYFTDNPEELVYKTPAQFDWDDTGGINDKLKIKNMGVGRTYRIEFYDAFTGDPALSITKISNAFGKLRIEYPTLANTPYKQDAGGLYGSMLLIKVYRTSVGSFIGKPQDELTTGKFLESLLEKTESNETISNEQDRSDIVDEEAETNASMLVVPNPANKEVKIILSNEYDGKIEQLEVRSVYGGLIESISQPELITTLNITNYAQGIYYIVGTGDGITVRTKLFKQ